MKNATTFDISIISLWVLELGDDGNQKRPLSYLDDDEYSHIHGELKIEINGKQLPYMGFFGPDDVCYNTWACELSQAARTLGQHDPSNYVFDEGEEGQPAFEFTREGDEVSISIIDSSISAISGGYGDPDWMRVPCKLIDFEEQISEFLTVRA